jgi:succinate dehydrogenase / fumarate reductase flavoprotein subunit
MSESLRNDGRVWVPKDPKDRLKPASEIPDAERDYYLERKYPSFGNLVPRDVASRSAKYVCDEGRGVGQTGRAVYLDFRDAIRRVGEGVVRDKYGNLFQMYERISGVDPYKNPMTIYPAVHYTMGGLWVDYNLMSNLPGLHVLGEANFSDHGANRLGASALMQGLADGYFVIPYTIGNYIAGTEIGAVTTDAPEFRDAELRVAGEIETVLSKNTRAKRTVMEVYRELGTTMWDDVGMARTDASLKRAILKIQSLGKEYAEGVKIAGNGEEFNKNLEMALRLNDFIELGALMARDALERAESCGGHFREESQTPDGEAKRDDDKYSYVAAWEYKGAGLAETLHQEKLEFEFVHPSQRSYK